jgi:anaerobic dimethyl sulfoxide reductase subunit A
MATTHRRRLLPGLNYTYGGWADGNSPSDIENSQLVVLFGNNPGETRMSGGGVTYYLNRRGRNPMPG